MLLDGKPLPQTRYGLMRKDVAEVFGIPAAVASGWAVEADLSGWARRCYEMTLSLIRTDARHWQSRPVGNICLTSLLYFEKAEISVMLGACRT